MTLDSNMPPIRIIKSPVTLRTTVVASNRANRGGMASLCEKVDRWILEVEPHTCNTKTFNGAQFDEEQKRTVFRALPYFDKMACPFEQGKETGTTEEYARVENGEMIIHPHPIFPGSPGWQLRVIDNKFPLFDKKDFATGAIYQKRLIDDGFRVVIDARGKDYVIAMSPHHIATPLHIDYYSLSRLEQIFAARELQDPDVGYVVVGSNNSGLPHPIKPRYKIDDLHVIEYLYELALPQLNGQRGAVEKFMKQLVDSALGHYESKGHLSGASQPHPHGRVISLPIMPEWVSENYKRAEEFSRKNGNKSVYEMLLRDELLIKDEGHFALIADPVPEYSGQLIIVARDAHNITELNDAQLRELAEKRKLAQLLVDLRYNLPSNVYMIQTFGKEDIDRYPHTRLMVNVVPRTGTKAVLEMATHLDASTTTAEQTAADMKCIMNDLLKGYDLH